jgi:hypothetical protein
MVSPCSSALVITCNAQPTVHDCTQGRLITDTVSDSGGWISRAGLEHLLSDQRTSGSCASRVIHPLLPRSLHNPKRSFGPENRERSDHSLRTNCRLLIQPIDTVCAILNGEGVTRRRSTLLYWVRLRGNSSDDAQMRLCTRREQLSNSTVSPPHK